MSQFKAWTYSIPGYPSAIHLTPIALPSHPRKNEIHIQVDAASLNPADIQIINLPIWRLPGLRREKGIGGDFAGTVIAVGAGVSKWKIGDQVWGFNMTLGGKYGTLSEVLPLDTTKAVILPRPENLSATDAASMPLVFLTAYTALKAYAGLSDDPTSPPTILVLGGSTGVGIYTIQIAKKRLGCKVITTASTRNIDFVKGLGADGVIDYTRDSIINGVQQYISEGGYDAIIDCVGGTAVIPYLKTLLKPSAAYVTIVGDKTSRHLAGGPIIYPFFPRMILRFLLGYLGYSRKYYCISLDPKEEYLKGNRHLEKSLTVVALDMFEAGDLKVTVDKIHAFDDALKAFEQLSEGKSRGKIVVKCHCE